MSAVSRDITQLMVITILAVFAVLGVRALAAVGGTLATATGSILAAASTHDGTARPMSTSNSTGWQ